MEIRERITLHEAAGTTRVTKAVTIRNHGGRVVLDRADLAHQQFRSARGADS